MSNKATARRGVNFGGWLVLERWITPSLFHGLKAIDEYSFCLELGNNLLQRIKPHRDTFITAADFTWLAGAGVQAIRLPIGYWALGGEEPYAECADYIDFTFDQAAKHGMQVVLDVHAAPGSQNGWDHSGKTGPIEWPQPKNIDKTLAFIELLAQRYGLRPNLAGIELINEPHWTVEFSVLTNFYEKGYAAVRKHARPDVEVVISDSFRPYDWHAVLSKDQYENVVLDTHMYQVFSTTDKALDLAGHLHKARDEWTHQLDNMEATKPVMVGEWSIALPGDTKGLAEAGEHNAMQEYGRAQLEAFSRAHSWYYWAYRTETMPAWGLRDCVERGWLDIKSA